MERGGRIDWGGKFLGFEYLKWYFQHFEYILGGNLSCVKDLGDLMDTSRVLARSKKISAFN